MTEKNVIMTGIVRIVPTINAVIVRNLIVMGANIESLEEKSMRLIKGRSFYKEPWYNSYRCMMSRCYRPKDASYKYYGGRGIKVCDEWHDILNFETWVKEHPYFDDATIDRIDSNGNYEPNNCRWATMFEQDKNRRNSIIIEWNGESHNISEWARITGLNRSTLNNRYWRGDRGDRLFEKVRYERCHA